MRHDVVDRYYDPQTGQFLSVDPKVQVTKQPYVYVNDDPMRGSDPSGLSELVLPCNGVISWAAPAAVEHGSRRI